MVQYHKCRGQPFERFKLSLTQTISGFGDNLTSKYVNFIIVRHSIYCFVNKSNYGKLLLSRYYSVEIKINSTKGLRS